MAQTAAEKAQQAQWQAQDDLRTLAAARQIEADKARMAGVKKVATQQIKALSTVVKPSAPRGGKK